MDKVTAHVCASTLYATVLLIGVLVWIGWLLGVREAVAWGEGVTTKPTTATLLIVSGLLGTAVTKKGIRAALSAMVIMVAISPFVSLLGNGVLGILEDDGYMSVAPNIPSLGTVAMFVLFGATRLLRELEIVSCRWCGHITFAFGAVAIVGHLSHFPLMYFYVPNWSTAMAIPTAIGALALGAALIVENTQVDS